MFVTVPVNYAKVTFTLLIFIVGIIANGAAIFVVVILKEYKKSINSLVRNSAGLKTTTRNSGLRYIYMYRVVTKSLDNFYKFIKNFF